MALVFEKNVQLGQGCAAAILWHYIVCSAMLAFHQLPAVISCNHFHSLVAFKALYWVHCASSTASTPVLARYWHCISQDCQPVALHCFSLPTAGITFSCQVIEWHCNSICCHWMALHFQTLPAYGSTYVNGFASTSGCPHAMPQCFCLYGIHVR